MAQSDQQLGLRMISVNLCGGIGNTLFQYAFARSLSKTHSVSLLDSCNQYGCQLNRFNIALPILPHPGWRWVAERSLRFDPNPEIEDPAILAGYYQCERYFNIVENELKSELTLRDTPSSSAQVVASIIRDTPNSVMLHVRRGDYLTWAAQRHGTLPMSYYQEAAKHFSNPHFFVFSDDANYNLELPYPMTRVNCAPHEDIWLMSKCKNAIIANSSFSWWGAWLGADKTGTVIAPKQWFRTGNEDSIDIVPERWLRI
jgi:hypothetical protein